MYIPANSVSGVGILYKIFKFKVGRFLKSNGMECCR